MTATWIRVDGYPNWCRLAVLGDDSHATACLARISSAAQLELTTRTPDPAEACGACWRDYLVRQERGPTVDLIPAARRRGQPADLVLEQGPGDGWPLAIDDLVSGVAGRRGG
jgi:hypothetical protein